MNKPTLVLEKIIVIPTKPKNKSVMFDIIDSYPATLKFSYDVELAYGCVADVNVMNVSNNKCLYQLKPHNIAKVLSRIDWYEVV